ncbi:MAG: YlxR family protein [Prochlorotrichaceae cyanobacterium]|jgi:predicted RNA-binding protein YlxR (DUF448 family)
MPPEYRRCVSCRRVAHRRELWRIVRVSPSGTLQLDQGQGRSAYLCPSRACLQEAKKRKRLERSLRSALPSSIFQTLEGRLEIQEKSEA